MPNAAAPAVSAQQTPPITRAFGDQDRDQSADESWSAVDSDNDLVTQNGNASRSLKRKRPLTVSYVPLPSGLEHGFIIFLSLVFWFNPSSR